MNHLPYPATDTYPWSIDPSYARKYREKSRKRDALFGLWDKLREAAEAAAGMSGTEEILASISKAEGDVIRKIVADEGSAA